MISNKIKVSALGSLYIKESPIFLEQALDSLLKQTYELDEIILMIDGPILQEHEKVISKNKYTGLLNIYRLENNVGLGEALKTGIGKIQNEYILRFDTDDINDPDRLLHQLEYMLKNGCDICSTNVKEFQENPGDLDLIRRVPENHEEIKRTAKLRNPINHMSVIYKKSVIERVGSYESVFGFEDYYLWCKCLISNAKFGNLNRNLVFARIGNDMIGRRAGYNYVVKELHFAKLLRRIGFLDTVDYLKFIVFRVPLRVVPKKFLSFLYKYLLRTKS